MSLGFSPKLPLTLSPRGGYVLNDTIPQMIKQNLKMLLLTSPGERIMDNNFGVGLKNFLFEQNVRNTRQALKSRIEEQVEEYMPFLDLIEIDVTEAEDQEIYVSIIYDVPSIQAGDKLILANRVAGQLVEVV